MNEDKSIQKETASHSFRVRLPSLIIEEPLGLGDVITRATRTLGIKACGGCEARARTLNRWLTFTLK